MISLSALESTALVLFAILLLASAGLTAKDVLHKKADRLMADNIAFKVAREIDLFYCSMCSPGAYCMTRIRLPDTFCGLRFSNGELTICTNGLNASSGITAPITDANYHLQNTSTGTELVLWWSY